ncbi:NAD(P)H-hydrate dehydratase [Rubellimicrobium sp. CFH 75288]|uniref:NAD(P)H-hydrate dehydratase n=1 Tax=Rubellimicrobium sp. CFH 75288 TaxID=2697034 RepID=UPI0014121640|nr:NAD(P)H-hydrate dehydratase [Rubellimicrobium sp. CFH 75288]NAZ35546.1 NAD(P)H-hydrate dehydratase [Rubellimicrobium sp. CFH 75288]
MATILTAEEMRQLEAHAFAAPGGPDAETLMERAGQGVVAAMLETWPDAAEGSHRALVLCGPGSNGGDGFVVARLLLGRGWAVEAWFAGDPARQPPAARAMRERLAAAGGRIVALDLPLGAASPLPAFAAGGQGAGFVVDALFGIGLARPLDGPEGLWRLLGADLGPGEPPPRRVAVDIPSGLCADSGRVLRAGDGRAACFSADLTVTFHAPKPGHLLAEGPQLCGRLSVASLGPLDPPPGWSPAIRLIDEAEAVPERRPAADGPPLGKRTGHKYDHGHALILGGGPGRGGAARLAARAALRVGTGLVTLAVPSGAIPENAARLDAVMLREADDASDLSALLEDGRFGAVCAGPAFGTTPREAACLAALLDATGRGRAAILDADAITLLAREAALRRRLHPRVILTPHDGEFARLCPGIAARLHELPLRGPAFSRLDAAHEAAAALGCVLLLKGPDTVIADPQGRLAIHAAAYDRAAPWLATAGAGDVLSGLVCGLLARGFAPFAAAASAAWLHVEAARAFGPGLIAEDLPEALPGLFRRLGL